MESTSPCVTLVDTSDPPEQLKNIGVAKVITVCVRLRSRSCLLRLHVWANASPYVAPSFWFRIGSVVEPGSTDHLDADTARRLLLTPPYRQRVGFVIAGLVEHYRTRAWVDVARIRFVAYREVERNGHHAEISLQLIATDGRCAPFQILVSGSPSKLSYVMTRIDPAKLNGNRLSGEEVRRIIRRKAAQMAIRQAIPPQIWERL